MTLPNDALVDDNNDDDDDGADANHLCEEEGEEENMKSGQGEQQGVKTETQESDTSCAQTRCDSWRVINWASERKGKQRSR